MRSLTVQAAPKIRNMCGRYAQTLGAEEIVETFDLAGSTLDQSLRAGAFVTYCAEHGLYGKMIDVMEELLPEDT